jgi:xylose dehydrogenase (NAD/NADP)
VNNSVKSIRWGLIGAGWIATKAIAPAIHAANNAILQGVASRDPIRAQALNPITIAASYQSLINDPQIDAVYISLPNHLHCQWTVAALSAGKHVLCEKPFAINSTEVELMTKAATENGRLLVEAASFRWHPRIMRLIEYVKAGNIGQIISIDSSFTFPAEIAGNYRASKEMGGGALFDVGVYPLHAAFALIGDNATMVAESNKVHIGPTGIDLTSKWQMRINEAITLNGLASFEMPESQTLTVNGEKGSAELIGGQAFTSWHSPSTLRLDDAYEEFDAVDPYKLMIEGFGKKVNGEDAWVLPLASSLSVQKALDQLQVHKNPAEI